MNLDCIDWLAIVGGGFALFLLFKNEWDAAKYRDASTLRRHQLEEWRKER